MNRLLNRLIHYLGFGLASHLGVECDIPCVGVAKKLYHVDGLVKDAEYREKVCSKFCLVDVYCNRFIH